MPQRFSLLAWTAALATYLLIILGAIVRITGSGMGCGEHWPLCRGKLIPPLDLPTLIEYAHRLSAGAVSVLVLSLAAFAWWLGKTPGEASVPAPASENVPPPGRANPHSVRARGAAYVALGLLVVQVVLGAVTVKLDLPAWTVVLHLGTAMLLLAALLTAARNPPVATRSRTGSVALALGFVTVLFGGLTANLGAASACLGFPLCNYQVVPQGNYLQHVHWSHRLLAYALVAYTIWWAARTRERGAIGVLVLISLQVVVAAAMIELALPPPLQATHAALGAAVWAGLVLAVL